MRKAVVGAALVAIAAGCGGASKSGDPGDRRLHELAADPVFAGRAPGAGPVTITQIRARYAKPGLEGGGRHGPGIVVSFGSSTPPRVVYAFFARRARTAGWTAASAGALGLTDVWRKTYRDGARATLLLSLLDLRTARGPRHYVLSGGISLG